MKHLAALGIVILLFASAAQAEEVLFIGDSHGVFEQNDGSRMGSIVARAIAADHSLAYFSACGASAVTWTRGGRTTCGYRSWSTEGSGSFLPTSSVPTFGSLLVQHRPAIVVIELGDNLFEWARDTDGLKRSVWVARNAEPSIRELLSVLDEEAPDALCLWIGPTHGGTGRIYRKTDQALESLYDSLKKTVTGRCALIDTRPMIPDYRGTDGLHLSGERSRMLGDGVAQAVLGLISR